MQRFAEKRFIFILARHRMKRSMRQVGWQTGGFFCARLKPRLGLRSFMSCQASKSLSRNAPSPALPRHLQRDGKGFAFASRRLSLSVDVSVSHKDLDSRPTGQSCNAKVNLCLIEITSVLLLCYQPMYSSCNTTALHVAVAALKVLGR